MIEIKLFHKNILQSRNHPLHRIKPTIKQLRTLKLYLHARTLFKQCTLFLTTRGFYAVVHISELIIVAYFLYGRRHILSICGSDEAL